ncbi:hypothetical protein NDU88_002301 [Pleurodeles waltl]|uniref:Uncharacterized protein n=1 Tax=Pleurodeles waltl TaxID=8319 RepID=A0AAV7NHK6_PLEWA|nr:hypothetical protein NDU88_002301 [Pleurodeles waltl]
MMVWVAEGVFVDDEILVDGIDAEMKVIVDDVVIDTSIVDMTVATVDIDNVSLNSEVIIDKRCKALLGFFFNSSGDDREG